MTVLNSDTNSVADFDKRLLIEQIRYIETEQTFVDDIEEISLDHSHPDFESRLWQRARHLVERYHLSPSLGRAAKLSRYANIAAWMVAALLGALGIAYAVTDVGTNISAGSHTINIYGLLLVLLGFNFISILLWLTGISLNMEGLASGVLARLTRWLPNYFGRKNNSASQADKQTELADKAWFACHFGGRVGKWQLSKITHRLWLVYLSAGLVFLVLLLMVRQYDFVWGTTLLSDSIFVKLTDMLSAPLQAFGFTTPTADQVQETRIGAEQILTVEHRSRWAQFLLGALLLFGIVPRIIFWIWSALMHRRARRQFTLDYYLPYYIHLRQQLMPLATHGQIVDEDMAPPVISETPVAVVAEHGLPENAKWVVVEPGKNINWPPASVNADNDLGKIIDRDSMTNIQQRLQKNPTPVLAIAVSSARPPDRGVQRIITGLVSSSKQCWLVLLQNDTEAIATTRLESWYRVAETCGVSADHVISMSVN